VSLVYAPAGEPGLPKAAIADALRVLAVFSQPTETSVLALRRERYALGKLIRRLAATQRRMMELKVVQYRVTREKLAEIVGTGDGWDVLHLSGHGGPGAFLLEHPDGSPDPVDVAVARALKRASGVALATPGVFGVRAAGLVLPVPRGTPRLDPDETPTAYLPPEPTRFVGRAEAMARASTALASAGRTGVLLHGMAGAGKTACAVELAYRHQDSFAAVAFWQGPTREEEWEGALAGLATALETQLGRYGFAMTGHIGTVQELAAFLPRLRQLWTEQGVLLVLDNLEPLLTTEGTWRDPRWDPLNRCPDRPRRRIPDDHD
jgi:hypothetical protein